MVVVPSFENIGKDSQKKGLVPLELPKIPVYKNVQQYLVSKAETRRIKKFPEWDIPRSAPSTELVRARRDLYNADQHLTEKHTELTQRRLNLDAQWEQLRLKEEELRASFLKFNSFTKENQDKRERAELRIKEEQTLHIQQDIKITELESELSKMSQIKETMEKYVNDYKLYKEFLESVVAVSEFKEIPALLNRFETLAEARAELATRQFLDIVRLEATRKEMMNLLEQKSTALIGFNTKIAELENLFEKQRANALKWEAAIVRAKAMAKQKQLDIRLVQNGAWNLYKGICLRKGVEVVLKENDTEEQLFYIKGYLIDLRKIIVEAKKKETRDLQSLQGISHEPKILVAKVEGDKIQPE